MRGRAPFIAAVTLLVSASSAHAEPTKQECVAANSAAQDLRSVGRLREAQVKLALCVSASCPGPVREDCADRLREVEKATPSIVFEAKDGDGNDLSAVAVSVDGQPLAKKLDGGALVIDPGEHTFTFQMAGRPAVEKKLVVREGEKGRRERVTLRGTGEKARSEDLPSGDETPSRVPAIIAFGAGGVGLVVGIVFAGLWASDKSAGDAACTPVCPTQTVADGWSSKQTGDTVGAAVGFAVAGAGAITGAILLLASSSTPAKATVAQIRPQLGFGWAGVEATF